MRTSTRRLSAVALSVLLGAGLSACSDEDGDGATTDEEVGELEDTGDSVVDEVEEEVDEGEAEAEE